MPITTYSWLGNEIYIQKGEIVELAPDNKAMFLASVKSRPGFSGSPCFSEGHFIGLIVQRKKSVEDAMYELPWGQAICATLDSILPSINDVLNGTYQAPKHFGNNGSRLLNSPLIAP